MKSVSLWIDGLRIRDATAADQLWDLLGHVRNEQLPQIVVRRMEGFSNEGNAVEEQISIRSVERKLQLVRESWRDLLEDPE